MKVLDLFSGIGGFSLGLERAGMETVAFCENDAFCQKVLAKHWPGVPIHDNIEELNGRQYKGTAELICGGFPCQPFSVAGGQRGAEDDRALWPEMLRIIREVEPAWVIGENVSGIINMELDNVLSDLEDSGYSCQSFVVPACAIDAPHRRDRVWVIAQKNDSEGNTEERNASDVADADSKRTSKLPSLDENAERQAKFRAESSGSGETVAHTSIKRLQGSKETGDSLGSRKNREQLSTGLNRVPRRDKSQNQSRMGGMADGVSRWLDEPGGIPRVIGKVPDRTHRLKALGNAVVPQVVEVLGRMVMEAEGDPRRPGG